MIRLTYAHRWTNLVDALAAHLTEARDALGPLLPLTVIIPHRLAGGYLKLALADRLGIAANLRFSFLRAFLTETYEAGGQRRVLTPARLEHLLLAVLDDVQDPALTPVHRYLHGDGPTDRRRAQLARALARIFDDYALTRPEMLAAWSDPGAAPDTEPHRWQAALWRRLRARADACDGPTVVALDATLPPPATAPAALFVFDVFLGSSVLSSVLARWAVDRRVELYATNPCMEFWEDLPAGGRAARAARARLQPRAQTGWSDVRDEADPLPLLLWGRPGRDNVRLLNALTECDFDGRFEGATAPPSTLLARLQHDVLHRAPPSGPPRAADSSVEILACPGARREAEVIAESIWSMVAGAPADAPLSFADIGIVLAGREADAYRSHFSAVFDEYHQVPHHFLEVPVARSSRVVEAVELLLALPASRFTRQDLLRLLTHPTVLPEAHASTADEWVAWCEDLAIVHGADHADHADTYIEADLLNWDQGLTRLVLGLFMAASNDDGPRFHEVGARRYLPHEVPFDRTDSAAHMVTLARSLIADARFVAAARLSMADWAALMRTILAAYITPRDDADERDLLRVLGLLEALEDDDLTGIAFRYPVVQEVLTDALAGLTENVGQPLADGVVVAPLRLAASLPLRVVFLPGLHEGAFSVRDPNRGLDVRSGAQRPGEVGPREREQYQFLSRLMATDGRVILSYVATDPATGEARAPAPAVVELQQILAPYLETPAEAALLRRPAHRRYHGAPHPYASPAARREASTRALRDELAAHAGAVDPATVQRRMAPESWRRLRATLGLHLPPDKPVALPDTVTLRALRLFLEDPLQGWVHHTLGLRQQEDADDRTAVIDERFRTDPLSTHMLLRTVVLEAVREQRSFELVYDAYADRLEVTGVVPTGLFKVADRRRHLQVLEGWTRGLRKVFANRPRPFDPFRLGRGGGPSGAARVVPALLVPLGAGSVEVRGTTQPAVDRPPASVILRAGRKPAGGAPTHELAAFVDQVARSASGALPDAPYTVWTVYGDGEAVRTELAPFDRPQAEAYLGALVRALRTEPHDYLLPFATVHRAYQQGGLRGADWPPLLAASTPARYGPLASVNAAPPSPQRAQQILAERYGPFYQRRTEEGGP